MWGNMKQASPPPFLSAEILNSSLKVPCNNQAGSTAMKNQGQTFLTFTQRTPRRETQPTREQILLGWKDFATTTRSQCSSDPVSQSKTNQQCLLSSQQDSLLSQDFSRLTKSALLPTAAEKQSLWNLEAARPETSDSALVSQLFLQLR